MSGNPFETSLKTLHEAAAIGQINAEVVRLLEQPKRQFEFTIPVRMDDGHLEIFQAFRGFSGLKLQTMASTAWSRQYWRERTPSLPPWALCC